MRSDHDDQEETMNQMPTRSLRSGCWVLTSLRDPSWIAEGHLSRDHRPPDVFPAGAAETRGDPPRLMPELGTLLLGSCPPLTHSLKVTAQGGRRINFLCFSEFHFLNYSLPSSLINTQQLKLFFSKCDFNISMSLPSCHLRCHKQIRKNCF